MLPTPSSSPVSRVPLDDCTNSNTPSRIPCFPPTPSSLTDDRKAKRPSTFDGGPNKRVKLTFGVDQTRNKTTTLPEYESDSDAEMEDIRVVHARERRTIPFRIHSDFMMQSAGTFRRHQPSTLALLQSFVSSNKSDVFKCQSTDVDAFLTPPYACSYTYGAKRGGTPLLAVATEQGSVHILNTSRRQDWDTEPPRVTLQPHNNGVFDVKWNMSDALLATCSGDHSTHITDVERETVTHALRGHKSTVKCVAWDPKHKDLLSSGGRDGALCLWDLRVAVKQIEGDLDSLSPVMTILSAHENMTAKGKPKVHRGKKVPMPRSVTNVLYPECNPYGVVSSGSYDGILKYWDLRTAACPQKSRSTKSKIPTAVYSSPVDPTTLHGSRRPRGIISLTAGSGPTAGLIFGLGADSRVHTYNVPSLSAHHVAYTHDNMQTNSFYVGLTTSPCGRWLASGGTGSHGSNFLFDVTDATLAGRTLAQQGVELKGQVGEVGAVDWAYDTVATCADDGTVRVWRPDIATYRQCRENPEDKKWDWSWSLF